MEPVKLSGNYDTGQMFLHRLFGYRGVILFPWTARVYDRDLGGANAKPLTSPDLTKKKKDVKVKDKVKNSDKEDLVEKEHKPERREYGVKIDDDPAQYPLPGCKEVKGKTHTYYQVYTVKSRFY